MPRAFLGQNFLISEDWQKKIVSYFEPPGEFLEIGPGRSALTQHLLKRFKKFSVIEKDPELAKLHRQNSFYQTLEGDFLDWDFCLEKRPVENFSFIGNLPYETGSAMLGRISERASQISHFVFLLQKEVVERISAKPHTRDFASFTVMVQGQFEIEALDVIGPEFFRPAPEVFSQILRGRRRTTGAHPTDPKYFKFLKRSFLHKRKTLKNAWKGYVEREKLDRIYEVFGFKAMLRAEEVPVDLWPKIFEEIKNER
jgi:16S rRNA (adenine1518-N6/adenine1519-N6)-dimethyltransferase